MKAVNPMIIASITAFGLTACGGGSGDIAQPVPRAAVVIDSANAKTVSGSAAEAALDSRQFGGMSDFTGTTSSGQNSLNKSDALASVGKIVQGTLGNVAVSLVPVGPETTACTVSGTVTVSGEIADPLTLTAGDIVRVESDNCDDGDGTIVDGLLEMTIASFAGDILTSQFLLGVDLSVTDFSITENGNIQILDGSVGTTIDTRTPPIYEGSVFGDRFAVSGTAGSESLSNFSTIYTEDVSSFPVAWTTDAMGTVESSEFDGSVSYDTPVVFQGSGESFPFAGELLVTGANDATLRLITIDNVNVQIDADYDGDGVVDETINTTWAELVG